jgi:hypothetical protein
MTPVQFQLVVKQGRDVKMFIEGMERRPLDQITLQDLKMAAKVEQYLERMFGYRFHIQEVPEVRDDG